MVRSKISYNKANGTYEVSFIGLSKEHVKVLASVLGKISSIGFEIHSINGSDHLYMHLETFCPMADVHGAFLLTQYTLLSDFAHCFTSTCDLPTFETHFSRENFAPLGYEW